MVAIAEKVARLEQERWANRKPMDAAARADGLELLRRGGMLPAAVGDKVPAEYLAWKRGKRGVKASNAGELKVGVGHG